MTIHHRGSPYELVRFSARRVLEARMLHRQHHPQGGIVLAYWPHRTPCHPPPSFFSKSFSSLADPVSYDGLPGQSEARHCPSPPELDRGKTLQILSHYLGPLLRYQRLQPVPLLDYAFAFPVCPTLHSCKSSAAVREIGCGACSGHSQAERQTLNFHASLYG